MCEKIKKVFFCFGCISCWLLPRVYTSLLVVASSGEQLARRRVWWAGCATVWSQHTDSGHPVPARPVQRSPLQWHSPPYRGPQTESSRVPGWGWVIYRQLYKVHLIWGGKYAVGLRQHPSALALILKAFSRWQYNRKSVKVQEYQSVQAGGRNCW